MGCSSSSALHYGVPHLKGPSSDCIVLRHEKSCSNGGRNPPEVLTVQQKDMVQRSWATVMRRDLTAVGMLLFKNLFQQEPRIMTLFSLEASDDEDLEQNLRLRLHAARFMQAVGAVIDNLQTPNDKLSALLSDIGERHSHLHSFHHEYFRAFREAFLTTLEHSLGKDRFKGELRAAWDSVIGFMTREMNHGHKEIRI
ncbi:hypothetical protein C0Q70_10993 [Pomacea canaliculata]|uniref:Globin n=1 Tax=Pomacea canaliculata TaxID=400727 RepID=A0A2T7P4S4_POMCA|nr:cytoglobin-2-like [Pomacea canaliculata]PVD28406.1 hypothetical protein C0Q70_10993 [Pomacea canaliculata]